jgi:hypothetical protein
MNGNVDSILQVAQTVNDKTDTVKGTTNQLNRTWNQSALPLNILQKESLLPAIPQTKLKRKLNPFRVWLLKQTGKRTCYEVCSTTSLESLDKQFKRPDVCLDRLERYSWPTYFIYEPAIFKITIYFWIFTYCKLNSINIKDCNQTCSVLNEYIKCWLNIK